MVVIVSVDIEITLISVKILLFSFQVSAKKSSDPGQDRCNH